MLSVLPFCFGYGLSQLTTTLLVGGTLVLQRTSMPGEIVRTIQETGKFDRSLVRARAVEGKP